MDFYKFTVAEVGDRNCACWYRVHSKLAPAQLDVRSLIPSAVNPEFVHLIRLP
jgi:hypothetical protein